MVIDLIIYLVAVYWVLLISLERALQELAGR